MAEAETSAAQTFPPKERKKRKIERIRIPRKRLIPRELPEKKSKTLLLEELS
jgi:hypothetical protein